MSFLSLFLGCQYAIIEGKLHDYPDMFREFSMQVYCFPRPQVVEQAILIKSIGSTQNALADVMIRMVDHEKLVICREYCQASYEARIQW